MTKRGKVLRYTSIGLIVAGLILLRISTYHDVTARGTVPVPVVSEQPNCEVTITGEKYLAVDMNVELAVTPKPIPQNYTISAIPNPEQVTEEEPEHHSLIEAVGFEFSTFYYPEEGVEQSSGATTSLDSTIKNTGSQSLKIASSSNYAYFTYGPASYRISFYLYIDTAPNTDCKILGSTVCQLYLTTDRYVDLYYGGVKQVDGTTQLALDEWNRLSISTDTGDTSTRYWINGGLEGSDDDQTSVSPIIGIQTSCTATLYFDDLVVDNEHTADPSEDVGDVRVQPVLPNGEGYHQDQSSGVYTDIDELPKDASTADKVFLEAGGSLIEYTCDLEDRTDLGIDSSATIEAVQYFYYYETAGGGSNEYFDLVRDNSTDYSNSVDDPKDPTWALRAIDVIEPNSGSAWDWTTWDAFEVGMSTDDANKDLWLYTAGVFLCYIPPAAGCSEDISNTPSSKAFNVVAADTTYYAYGSAPSNPVVDGECTFTVTNSSGGAIDITIKGTNFTGGVGWTYTSGSPGENTVRMTAYYSGQNPASGVVLTTSPQAFISGLADSGTKKWDFKFETGTSTDGVEKSSTLTLSATCQ